MSTSSVTAARTATGQSSGGAIRVKRKRTGGHARSIIGFLAPFVILFLLFYIVPIIYAAYQSFLKVQRNGTFGAPTEVWGGFTQYKIVFQTSEFWGSLGRVLLFFVISTPIQLILALVFALLLDSSILRAKMFLRLSIFAPYAVPGVIAAIMWGFMYAPSLSPFGFIAKHLDLLGSGLILISIANVVNWVFTGYNMLIIYSALKAIPEDIFEAARTDGAGAFRQAWSIKIPLVMPSLIMTGVFSIIGTLQLFNEPTVFRTLSSAVSNDYTPNMVVFSTSNIPNYNLSAAFSVVLAVVTCALSFLFLKVTQKRAFV